MERTQHISRSGEKGRTIRQGGWGKVDCCMLEQRVVWLISRKSKITWMVCPFWVIIGNIFMPFLHPNIEDSTFHWLSFILQHKSECWWLDKGKNSNVSHSGELSPMLYVRRNMFEQGKLDFFYVRKQESQLVYITFWPDENPCAISALLSFIPTK